MSAFFSSSDVQKKKPTGIIAKCGSCGLYKGCASPKMKHHGKGRKGVLIVGEAPDSDDDEEGRLFAGKPGQMLRESLGEIGIDLDKDAWTTNSLICHPPDDATPNIKQIGWCRPNLIATLKEVKPRVVITLGRSALVSVIADYWKSVETLDRWIGWKIPLESHWLCPTYHPNFLLRMNNDLMDRRFADDLRVAFEIDEDPPSQPDWKKAIDILYDEDEIVESLKQIHRNSEWVAVDYETNCLKPEYPKAAIYSCAVSNGERTITYPWKGEAIRATGILLGSKRTRKIASNLKMEEKWTRAVFGFGIANWGWDTMIAAHCLDNRALITSLKFQSLVKLGVPTYNDLISPYLAGIGWYNRVHHIELSRLLHYNGMDALLEYRLAMQQRSEMGYA